MHCHGRELETRLPLVVVWHGFVAYFCLCNKCASRYARQQREQGWEFSFLWFETKSDVRAHMVQEGSFWMTSDEFLVRSPLNVRLCLGFG